MMRWLKRLYSRYKAWRLRGRPGAGWLAEDGFYRREGLPPAGNAVKLPPGKYQFVAKITGRWVRKR